MELKCQVCGQSFSIPVWSEQYEKLKRSHHDTESVPPFICEICQEKIRLETNKDRKF